jgi:hypothetical protein
LAQQAIVVFVGPALPRTLWITKVDLDLRRHREYAMRRELAAAIPCERLHESLWQPANATSERSNDRVGFLVWQAHEYDVARLTLDECGNEGSSHAFQEVAFPMAGQRAIRDFGWPLTNGDGIDNLPLRGTDASAGARMSKVALPAELPEQGTLQDTATLNKQASIDRFGRHLHVRIAWKGVSKPSRDLLR